MKSIVIIVSLLVYCSGLGESSAGILDENTWYEVLRLGLQKRPEIAEQFLTRLGSPTAGRRAAQELRQDTGDLCGICQTVAPIAKTAAFLVPDYESVQQLVFDTCKLVVEAVAPEANTDILCITVDIQGPHVLTILKSFRSNTEKICRNLNLCFDPVENQKTEFFPGVVQKAPESRPKQDKAVDLIRIAQLADIHVDPLYAVGSATDCGLPVCCRDTYEGTGSAGEYGSYLCNTPQRTVDMFMEKIKALDNPPDFVIYTGDNPPHHAWDDSKDFLLQCTELVMDSLQRILAPQFTVFPALGNHEAHPTNLFYLDSPDVQELMENLPGWWQPLANMTQEQLETINKAAYYTMSSPVAGLRVITLNSNFWYAFNFYNILNEGSTEAVEMEEWLVSTLQSARDNGEKVVMVLHHPLGGNDFIHTYSRWYSSLILEYSDIVVLQVAGHTHHDEFRLFIDPEDSKAKNVLHVAPSVTARSTPGPINPSMRVFNLDPVTFELIEYEQYRMYLDNESTEVPEIELVYKATSEFGLPDLTPESYLAFAEQMRDDDALFQKWFSTRNTDAPRTSECVGDCQQVELCQLITSSFDEFILCSNDSSDNSTSPAS